jgi:hypothetical protein
MRRRAIRVVAAVGHAHKDDLHAQAVGLVGARPAPAAVTRAAATAAMSEPDEKVDGMGLTRDELRAGSIHALWSLRQLLEMATHLGERHQAGVSVMTEPHDVAALDSFCVHARALNEFLWRDRHGKDRRVRATDAVAADWFKDGVWAREALPAELADVADRTGWGVAHVSYTRLREHVEWEFEEIAHRIAYRFACFAIDADPDLLGPGVRHWAESRIGEWRAALPFSVVAQPPRVVASPSDASLWMSAH